VNSARRQKFARQSAQEHRWIISYADFLTLLFAFFVFLFSVSTLESEKFQEVGSTLLQIFDVRPSSVEPIELNSTPEGPDVFNPLYQPDPIPGTQIDVANTEKFAQQSSLLVVKQQMGEAFSQLIEDRLFSVSGDESWLEIEISDSVTFLPGSADITNQAEAILYEVGKLLSSVNLPVAVEGYSLATEAKNEAASWLLSAERAVNVIGYLQQAGVAGSQLSAVAFSHYQPNWMSENLSEEGRISIVVAGFQQSVKRP
jgi:chemotaxis protein MotB